MESSTDCSINYDIKGRRVIDLSYVIEQMHCNKCDEILHLENIIVEILDGMASVFHIKCTKCSSISEVATSRTSTNLTKLIKKIMGPEKQYSSRIIDIAYLPKHLHCSKCNESLHLEHIDQETNVGFACIFNIKCMKCSTMNQVTSCEEYVDRLTGKKLFTINRDMALGVIKAEITVEQLIRTWEIIGVPGLDIELFKMHKELIENEMKEDLTNATAKLEGRKCKKSNMSKKSKK